MSRISKFRPGHGTVVGYLALFVALGGTSYAVGSGSVGTRQIKNNSVRTGDVRNGTLRSRDVGDNALTGGKILESSLGTVPTASQSGDSDHLDGLDSSAFLRKTGTAANADRVGGFDAGRVVGAAGFLGTYSNEAPFTTDPEEEPGSPYRLLFQCTSSQSAKVILRNTSGAASKGFIDDGRPDPVGANLANGQQIESEGSATANGSTDHMEVLFLSDRGAQVSFDVFVVVGTGSNPGCSFSYVRRTL